MSNGGGFRGAKFGTGGKGSGGCSGCDGGFDVKREERDFAFLRRPFIVDCEKEVVHDVAE
jgi:hypothetical protein